MWSSCWDSYKALVGRDTREPIPHATRCGHSEKVPSASQEVNPPQGKGLAGPLTLGFPASRIVGDKCLLLKPPGCGVMAAQAD